MFIHQIELLHSFCLMQILANILRATSCGTIMLKSADPFESPAIDPCYLSTKEDVIDTRNAVRLIRQVCPLGDR